MEPIVIIPARGGSKGVPGKNYKNLNSKPLIQYSIDVARALVSDENICVTTDSEEIINVANSVNLKVPFMRPAALATDSANSRDVILHALDYYANVGRVYDKIVLLQPTSPFRKVGDVKNMLKQWHSNIDMVVSVQESHENPYYSLFEEDKDGYLYLSKPGNFTRRQDVPKVYAYNGSVYVITVKSIQEKSFSDFHKVVRYEMDKILSLDIDTPFDWMTAEMIIEKKLWQNYE
jgi:CMP-N,N'-diacetyllegionaminic acid synthase